MFEPEKISLRIDRSNRKEIQDGRRCLTATLAKRAFYFLGSTYFHRVDSQVTP